MNVGSWPTKWARRYPNEPAIKYGELTISKLEFDQRINWTAHAFQSAGIKKGDRVCVLMANSNVFLEVLFAVSKLGAVMVPLNFRLAVPELDYIVNNSEPVMMVYSPEFSTVVSELKPMIPSMKQFICEAGEGLPDDVMFEDWIASQPHIAPQVAEEPTMDDPYIIMYTSGTTGRTKGAVITQGNTQWNAGFSYRD